MKQKRAKNCRGGIGLPSEKPDNLPNMIDSIRALLLKHQSATPETTKRFFKTNKGEYSEKEEFLGVPVPAVRRIAKALEDLPLTVIQILLRSSFNEERLLALIILVNTYQKSAPPIQADIYQFYLKNLRFVNNWNLVDSSAHWIIGAYLWDKDRSLLTVLASAQNLWERRVSIISTWYFIRQGDTKTTWDLASMLLQDKQDLIHKAVGWMLREAGKRDKSGLFAFLEQYAAQMPRTMLRYAIEKLSSQEKSSFLNKKT